MRGTRSCHHVGYWVSSVRGNTGWMLGEDTSVVKMCKHLILAENTYDRWPNQYVGIKADDAKR